MTSLAIRFSLAMSVIGIIAGDNPYLIAIAGYSLAIATDALLVEGKS